jgi:hypothetical protein
VLRELLLDFKTCMRADAWVVSNYAPTKWLSVEINIRNKSLQDAKAPGVKQSPPGFTTAVTQTDSSRTHCCLPLPCLLI